MIKSIKIRNFKSIENMTFDFEIGNNIICLLGKTEVENQRYLKP